MQARIYKPAKTAMQSGTGKTHEWLLEYEPPPRSIDPLMRWTSSADTRGQIRMSFETREEAIAFAEKHGILYSVIEPHARTIKPKAYADNFAYNRKTRWTH